MFGFLFILITAFFSGCQDKDIQATTLNNITLESDVVRLHDSSFTPIYGNRRNLVKVEISFILENIAGRELEQIQVYCEFYDNQDNLIARKPEKTIRFMPIGWIEQPSGGFNVFSYEGVDVEFVEYAILYAYEPS